MSRIAASEAAENAGGPAAGSVPDAVACPFLKTVRRKLRSLVEKPALHQSVKAFLEMLLFAPAFGMAEPREQREAVEYNRCVGGEHHVGQTGNTRHDLKPCAGCGERRCEQLEAAPSCGDMIDRILRPGVRLHPRVDRVGHFEMRGIGQQQQRLRRHDGFSAKKLGRSVTQQFRSTMSTKS